MKGDQMRQNTIEHRPGISAVRVAIGRACTSVRSLAAMAARGAGLLVGAHTKGVSKSSIAERGSPAPSFRILGAVILLAALAFAQNPLKRTDPFAGRFEGDQVALELTGGNGQYAGSLTVQGQKVRVTVRAAGATANGTMQVGGRTFSFTLAPTTNGLRLASEGSEYQLERHSGSGSTGQGMTGQTRFGNSIVGYWRNAQGHARFNADGTGEVDGENGRYEIRGNQLTLIGPRGQFTLPFEVRGDVLTLTVNGGPVTLNRAREEAGVGGIRQELVGKWCWVSVVNAQQGARTSNQCFTLYANGTYQYSGESDSYNPYGGATSQSADSGTWTATETTITAHSRTKGTQVYTLEKRNHPKNGDPMLVLNGQAFVTYYQKAPW
jgi:hypothetical protein